jgi:Flp pilus assembly protein TadG
MNTTEQPVSKSTVKKRFALLRRFGMDERGSNAIEFAILIFPFTLMMFAVIETGVSFAAQQILSNATDDVARGLRVNTITQAQATPAAIRDAICDEISILVAAGCPELAIDLREYPSFGAVPLTIPRTGTGDLNTAGFQITPGAGGTINNIRVFYRWTVYADFMRKYLAELPGGKTLLFSTLTWQNEPYES